MAGDRLESEVLAPLEELLAAYCVSGRFDEPGIVEVIDLVAARLEVWRSANIDPVHWCDACGRETPEQDLDESRGLCPECVERRL